MRACLSKRMRPLHVPIDRGNFCFFFFFCITSSCHIELVGQSAADWRDSRTIFLQDWPRVSVGKMRECCRFGCFSFYSPSA